MIDTKKRVVTHCPAFTFNATDQKVHPIIIEQQPCFIAVEVCSILGLKNPSEALRALDDDEKLTSEILRSGQKRKVNLVNESGLYNLIFRSNKPEAKKFRKWVTNEVLPSLRKNGSYSLEKRATRTNFIDLRDLAYDTVEVNGAEVRHIIWEDADWYSLNDVHKAIGSSTDSTNVARKLNAKRRLASKFYIYGNTHPAWFVKSSGLALILSGSRMLKNRGLKLVLPIPQAPQLKAGGAL